METCKVCDEHFKNLKDLSTHLNFTHKISSKDYYDKYLINLGGGKCSVCGGKTTYRGLGVGYLKTCSIECACLDNDIRKKRSESKKGKKQSTETIDKRVKNTDQIIKEVNRKKTMLDKYGVDNPSKLDDIKKIISKKNKGRKSPKTTEWLINIIKSKKNNGTLNHTDETKSKISNTLNKYHSENLDRDKYISQSNNIRHLCGWYNGLYFRSSLELSFLVHNEDKILFSCENNKYKILYDDNGKQRVYFPDFTDGHIIYEIKPTSLIDNNVNKVKIQEGINVYGDNYKVITEVESPYITKELIQELINYGKVKLTKSSEIVLGKYRF